MLERNLQPSTSTLKYNYLRKPTPYHSHRKIAGESRKRNVALWIDWKNPNYPDNKTPFRFTGKELDAETGLYYYGARYLDPKTSRWMSADPAMYQGDYIPSAPIDEESRKRNGNLPNGGIYNYINMHTFNYSNNNPVKYKDPDGREPIKSLVGTSANFKSLLNNSPNKVGTFKGEQASKYLLSLGKVGMNWGTGRIEPTQTGYFNNKQSRYIYTKVGGWIDMSHFMYYAGVAYMYKTAGDLTPIASAMIEGYFQETTDLLFASHSAFSYEDLSSDRLGAIFAVNYFDPNSDQTFGEQVESFLNNYLLATDPQNAPNYNDLPEDYLEKPSRQNFTANPVFTESNP